MLQEAKEVCPTASAPVSNFAGKPARWWQRSSVVSVALATTAALIFGLMAHGFSTPEASASAVTESVSQSQGFVPDAVQKVLGAGKPTVVEFGANSCASCREMKPILHALAQDRRIAVADVDIIKERDHIRRYQIRLMPTQVFYDAKGRETSRHMGTISGDEILERLGIAGSTNGALQKATL